jgi:hypothetical protein
MTETFNNGLPNMSLKSKKILVHLHLYYMDQADMFAGKIRSALNGHDFSYDLFITINEHNDDIEQKFLSFKPDAKFIIVKNIGADIFPFITVLNLINLKDYDYLIKLHTKKIHDRVYCPNCFAYIEHKFWSDYLTEFLTFQNIKTILLRFEQDEKLGMVANHRIILKNKMNKLKYPAGTMFIAKAHIFDAVKQLNLDESKFSIYKNPDAPYSSYDSFLYEIEQFTGNCANANGLELEDILTPKLQIFIWRFISFLKFIIIKKTGRFFFRIQNGTIKICKIPIAQLESLTIVEKGIIQPSLGKCKRYFRTNFFSAGVLTSTGIPVRRSKTIIMEEDVLSPTRINPSKTVIKYVDADAVYFSRPQNHFGHALTGTMSFAHILLNHKYKDHKIVFIDEEPSEAALILLEYLGAERKNIITITECTQFKSVVIVKQSFRALWLPRSGKGPYRGNREFIDTFRAIAQRFSDGKRFSPDKVYFSRRKLGAQSIMGEEKIELIFQKNGYEIFYPEQLPLDKQIRLVANADFYACIQGTLEHHSLFMKDGATLIVMSRDKRPTYRQIFIDKMQKTIKHVYLRTDVKPMGNNSMPGIVGATKDLIDFFDKNNFVYDAEDLKPNYTDLKNYIDFCLTWIREKSAKRVKKKMKKMITSHKDFWKHLR